MRPRHVILLGGIVGLLGCRAPAELPKVLRPVRVRTPHPSDCSTAPRFSGNVQPLARVDLAFKRGGYVAEVLRVAARPGGLVDEGDRVKRGTVLARLRDADYRVKLEQAVAQQLQASVALTQAQQDLERAKQLFAGGAMAQSLLDGAENKTSAAEAQSRAADALVDEAKLALQDCVLIAPIDGVVLKRLVEAGGLVGPGSPGFVLADTSSMKVVFGVPDMLLDRVRDGAGLEISVEALGPEPIRGNVSRVAPAADVKSRLFDVEVLLPNADGRLLAGMIAALRFDANVAPTASTAPAVPTAVSIPLGAVVRPPGKAEGFAVFVAEEDALRVRLIDPGELCGDEVELRSGLKPGERVVVQGAAQAFDGERVAIVP